MTSNWWRWQYKIFVIYRPDRVSKIHRSLCIAQRFMMEGGCG